MKNKKFGSITILFKRLKLLQFVTNVKHFALKILPHKIMLAQQTENAMNKKQLDERKEIHEVFVFLERLFPCNLHFMDTSCMVYSVYRKRCLFFFCFIEEFCLHRNRNMHRVGLSER